MTYVEVLEKVEKELKDIGCILIIKEEFEEEKEDQGVHEITYTNDFRGIEKETIEVNSINIVIQVVLLFHELGHHKYCRSLNPLQRKNSCESTPSIFLKLVTPEVIKEEEDAWDKGWELTIKFGLNKNRNFVRVFKRMKEEGLKSYEDKLSKEIVL